MSWQIIGHQAKVSYLKNSLLSGHLSHAYLFCGVKQLGKEKIAKQFAKSILCHNYQQQNKKSLTIENLPCHQCQSCLEFDKKTHPDVYFVNRAVGNKNISIEQIRELKSNLSSKSFFNSYKIALIDEADCMSLAASNALLKTLEEPAGRTVIILIVEKEEFLPKTIISRTQKIKFLPVSREDIYQALIAENNSDLNKAAHITNLSTGRPGRALVFLRSQEVWTRYIQNLNIFLKIISAKNHERLAFAATFFENKKSLTESSQNLIPILNLWQLIIRDLLLLKLDISAKIINSKAREELTTISPYFKTEKLVLINQLLEKTKWLLGKNVNPKLCFENLLINI